jgi:nitroreductase
MTWLDPQSFEAVVEAATRAPSMHNSQPWRFRLRHSEIDLLLDPDRRLPVSDPSGWASRLGCGAALLNLRLALAARGSPATVTLLPDRHDPHLLARLTPGPQRPPTPEELRLHAAIPHRRSNRAPFLEIPVPVDVRAELIAAARAEKAWLDLLIGPAAVEATAKLVHSADEALRSDGSYLAELSAWTRRDESATDGVPVSAGGPAPRPYDLLLRRDFGGPELPSHRDYERDPLVGVLGGDGDWPVDQLQVGQALQRILLTATDLRLAASMFSQPIEVPAVREQLRLALGRHGPPQMLLRFGYATPAPASPRRPVSEVVAS